MALLALRIVPSLVHYFFAFVVVDVDRNSAVEKIYQLIFGEVSTLIRLAIVYRQSAGENRYGDSVVVAIE